MDISKLQNLIQSLGFSTKKVEKTAAASTPSIEKSTYSQQPAAHPEADSISLSLEGMIKQTVMESKDESSVVREEKIRELTEKIASGTYHVNLDEVAKAIIYGKDVV